MRGRLWEIGCLRRVACGDLLVREESSVTKRREEEEEEGGGGGGRAGRMVRQDKATEMEREDEEERRRTLVKDLSCRRTHDLSAEACQGAGRGSVPVAADLRMSWEGVAARRPAAGRQSFPWTRRR